MSDRKILVFFSSVLSTINQDIDHREEYFIQIFHTFSTIDLDVFLLYFGNKKLCEFEIIRKSFYGWNQCEVNDI